jgi:site-specific recombinase XerD
MYDLRHLFASVKLSGGADLAAVSKLLGHSNAQQTTNTYYELLKGEKQALYPCFRRSSIRQRNSKGNPEKN